MFYSQEHNQYVAEGTPFTLGDVQYPANWLNLASADDKTAIGLQEVQDVGSPGDDRFYWVSTELQGAQRVHTNRPKEIDQVRAMLKAQINSTAFSMLSPTDYVDTRNLRDPSYKPEVMAQREAIRTAHAANKALIDAATTVDELAAISFTWPTTGQA